MLHDTCVTQYALPFIYLTIIPTSFHGGLLKLPNVSLTSPTIYIQSWNKSEVHYPVVR